MSQCVKISFLTSKPLMPSAVCPGGIGSAYPPRGCGRTWLASRGREQSWLLKWTTSYTKAISVSTVIDRPFVRNVLKYVSQLWSNVGS